MRHQLDVSKRVGTTRPAHSPELHAAVTCAEPTGDNVRSTPAVRLFLSGFLCFLGTNREYFLPYFSQIVQPQNQSYHALLVIRMRYTKARRHLP